MDLDDSHSEDEESHVGGVGHPDVPKVDSSVAEEVFTSDVSHLQSPGALNARTLPHLQTTPAAQSFPP